MLDGWKMFEVDRTLQKSESESEEESEDGDEGESVESETESVSAAPAGDEDRKTGLDLKNFTSYVYLLRAEIRQT